MSQRIEVGDTFTLSNTFSVAGVGTDATTVVLTVKAPDGTSSTPSVTSNGSGNYSATVTTTEPGLHVFQWVASGIVDDVASGSFRVFPLADQTLYASLDELKQAMGIDDSRDDDALQQALSTACRTIDDWTGRQFYRSAGVRYFTANRYDVVHVDDLVTITEVALDNGTGNFATVVVEDTNFFAAPRSAAGRDRPFTSLKSLGRSFPTGRDEVRVTGTFGWPAVPAAVAQAALLQAARIHKRTREAPFGIAGLNLDGGGMRLLARLDPDVELLLRPYQLTLFA